MIDNLQEQINKINENINVLPKNNKQNRAKCLQYIEENIVTFSELFSHVSDEVNFRYNEITNLKGSTKLQELCKKNQDYDLLCNIDFRISSFNKMNLDCLLYDLRHYYNEDLNNANETIFAIVNAFRSVGVLLNGSSFNYSSYVNDYMNFLFANQQDSVKIHDFFETIYWQCPDIISQIELNFKYLYLKNKKIIDKYYEKKYKGYKSVQFYVNKYNEVLYDIDKLKHTDKKFLFDKFINKKCLVNDYSSSNIQKLKENYLLNINSNANYLNLIKLRNSLEEYKDFTNYNFIITDIKNLYVNKASYKGQFESKSKEILKKEKLLFSFNKKLSKTGIFAFKENKKSEMRLKISNLINEIQNLYKELDHMQVTDDIVRYITDETSLLDVLRLVSNNYIYMVKLLKTHDENNNLKSIRKEINEFKKSLYEGDTDIISNISIVEEKNVPQIIADRYKLININITEESLMPEELDILIKNIETLIMSYDLEKAKINISDIDFILEVNKKVNSK